MCEVKNWDIKEVLTKKIQIGESKYKITSVIFHNVKNINNEYYTNMVHSKRLEWILINNLKV